MKTLYLVAGARPNFMKIAPLVRALRANGANLGFKIIHTGQHYDHELNDVFFDELGIPAPDVLLGAGSGSHAQQTAKIMVGFEDTCQKRRPRFADDGDDVDSHQHRAVHSHAGRGRDLRAGQRDPFQPLPGPADDAARNRAPPAVWRAGGRRVGRGAVLHVGRMGG